MHWVILGVIAASLLLLSSRYPRLAYGVLAGLLILGVLLYRFSDTFNGGEETDIPLQALELTEVNMLPGYADSFQFHGRLLNNSKKKTLAEAVIEITMLDCPPSVQAETTDCIVIGDNQIRIVLKVPPGQARDFHENVYFGATRASGELRWQHRVMETRTR